MSKSELINSALEDENNGTEESETSDNKYLSYFTKLPPNMYETWVSKESVKENCPGKESSDSEEGTSRIGNAIWCSCGTYEPIATHTESICCLDNNNSFLKYFYSLIY